MLITLRRLVTVLTLASAVISSTVEARKLSLIRDEEVETTIRAYATPIFRAAGLDPSQVRIHLVDDSSLNAFVAGGQRIFFHSGLLMATETPNQLIGIIAHETGHISGGHLARTHEALRDATAATILAMVLGGVAAAAGGGKGAGAVIAGAPTIGQSLLLRYTRTQERAADQAAIKILERTGNSSRGLLQFIQKLGDQELLVAASQDPYVQTHPLSQDRAQSLRTHVERSKLSGRVDPPGRLARHARLRAKLHAFIESHAVTLRRYPKSNSSLSARYARAIATYRHKSSADAVAMTEALIRDYPDDPYFRELKGQILVESGKVADGMRAYAEAVKRRPDSTLLRLGLAQAQVETQDPEAARSAIDNLELARRREPDNPSIWRWLASAYGMIGEEPRAALATAERYALLKRWREAGGQARRAMKGLAKATPSYLRASDIADVAKHESGRKDGGKQR